MQVCWRSDLKIEKLEEEVPPLAMGEPISPTQPFRTGLTQEDPFLPGPPQTVTEKQEPPAEMEDSPPRKEPHRAEDCVAATRGK